MSGGDERGAARKDPGGRVSVAMVWPGQYRVGMSSLGFLWCYALANSRPDALAERVFLPPGGAAAGRIRSLETGRELGSFDLVAGSLSWENDYWLFPHILRAGGMDPERSAREERGSPARPLVCVGGVGVWSNPWALFPFVDLVLPGEGEIVWEKVIDLCSEKGFRDMPALERTRALASGVPGALAPGLMPRGLLEPPDAEGLRRELAAFAPSAPPRLTWPFPEGSGPPRSTVCAPGAEFSGMRLVEMSRGCPWGCRFCLAGQLYRPHRPWDADAVAEAMSAPNPWSGEDPFPADAPVGLVSPAAADHPQFEEIVERASAAGRRVSFSSLRLSALTERAAGLLGAAGLKGAAVAPEGGTEELRARMNKNLSEDRIMEGARVLRAAGLRTLKLYFMFGLPGETDSDLRAAAALSSRVRDAVGGRRAGTSVSASFACFVPKPHTPFEGEPLLGAPEIRRRAGILRESFRAAGVGLDVEPAAATVVQGVLSRGGPEAYRLVRALLETRGKPSDSLAMAGVDRSSWLFRPLAPDAPRPWRVIAAPAGHGYLAGEGALAGKGGQSPPCPDGLMCGRCGACGYLEGS
ncbi:MAG: radical SAM protein [Deltaproteobacteria bacterium]|jgi:radical SAM superfamily enzyme YgiQ (UPF0313 family)|nr:radical SAM protein [Deltaproteobacteria bacterium]